MELDATILDRLKLRRAAIDQISGVAPGALDKLVAERQAKVRERRDARIAWLDGRLNEFGQDDLQ